MLMKKNDFDIDYLSFPLPYDNIKKTHCEYSQIDIPIENNKYTLAEILSNFYILIYRYTYGTLFAMKIHISGNQSIFRLKDPKCNYIDLQKKIIENSYPETNDVESTLVVININCDNWKLNGGVIGLNIIIENDLIKNISLFFQNELFVNETMNRLIDNLVYLIKQTRLNNIKNINEYNIVSEKEKIIIDNFNHKEKDWRINKTYTQYYYDTLSGKMNNIALIQGDKHITYKELNSISNFYATIFQENDNSNIALFSQNDLVTSVAILSILKAGKTVVAINPTYPIKRIKQIVKQLNITSFAVCNECFSIIKNRLENINIVNIYLGNKKSENIYNEVNKDDLCYIIFTSGTTGIPKGVKITHENIMTEINYFNYYFQIDKSYKFLHILNYSFDFGLYDLLSSILSGGCLYCIDRKKLKNFKDYINYLNDNEINFINTTPSFFNIICSFGLKLPYLKHVHLGGEKVTYSMIMKYMKVLEKNCEIYNGYGPCECTVGTNIYRVSTEEKSGEKRGLLSVPIGIPTDNSFVYVMDQNYMQVPINCLGELLVSGDCLGPGYVDSSIDKQKYITNHEIAPRLYCTGDLVRWDDKGNIEYIGRIDNQVKINGFRIEISEIDSTLLKMNEIDECKTVFLSERNVLVTYIKRNKEISDKNIKLFLLEYLPYYMIPSKLYFIQEFPLLTSGKIDICKLLLQTQRREMNGDCNISC